MRIVQLITQARGGPVDHAVDVANALAERGHESHLIGPEGSYSRGLASSVSMHVLDVASKQDLGGAVKLAALLRRLAPDVLHCQDRRAGLVGRVAAAASGVASVYTLHGVPDSLAKYVPGNLEVAVETRAARLGNLAAERWLARVPRSRVITPCEALAAYAVEHVGIRPDRIRAIHNGVGPDWIGPVESGERSSGLSGETRMAWVGVMQPVKRVPQLIGALASVPDVRLTLVGDGPERGRVEASIASHAVADRVDLIGFVEDPRAYLLQADVLVLPSGAEACPMAILQAMACGLPIIASDVGGIAEVVRDGVDGLLVPAGDHDTLVAAMRHLGSDVSARLQMGKAARERVIDRFTIGHTVARLLEVYVEAAA